MVLKKLSVLLLCLTLVLAAPRSMRLPEVEEKKEHVKPEEKEQVDDTIPEEVVCNCFPTCNMNAATNWLSTKASEYFSYVCIQF